MRKHVGVGAGDVRWDAWESRATSEDPPTHAPASSSAGGAATAASPSPGAPHTAGCEAQVTPSWATTLEQQRPRTRGECQPGGPLYQRPCPWVGCRHHLLLDIKPAKPGADRAPWLRANRSGVRLPGLKHSEPHQVVAAWLEAAAEAVLTMPTTCSLDVAERGQRKERDVAKLLGITHQGTNLATAKALVRLRIGLEERGITDE